MTTHYTKDKKIKELSRFLYVYFRGDNTPIIAVLKKGGLFHLYKI
jgi:hypothetical protein